MRQSVHFGNIMIQKGEYLMRIIPIFSVCIKRSYNYTMTYNLDINPLFNQLIILNMIQILHPSLNLF